MRYLFGSNRLYMPTPMAMRAPGHAWLYPSGPQMNFSGLGDGYVTQSLGQDAATAPAPWTKYLAWGAVALVGLWAMKVAAKDLGWAANKRKRGRKKNPGYGSFTVFVYTDVNKRWELGRTERGRPLISKNVEYLIGEAQELKDLPGVLDVKITHGDPPTSRVRNRATGSRDRAGATRKARRARIFVGGRPYDPSEYPHSRGRLYWDAMHRLAFEKEDDLLAAAERVSGGRSKQRGRAVTKARQLGRDVRSYGHSRTASRRLGASKAALKREIRRAARRAGKHYETNVSGAHFGGSGFGTGKYYVFVSPHGVSKHAVQYGQAGGLQTRQFDNAVDAQDYKNTKIQEGFDAQIARLA